MDKTTYLNHYYFQNNKLKKLANNDYKITNEKNFKNFLKFKFFDQNHKKSQNQMQSLPRFDKLLLYSWKKSVQMGLG